MSQEITTEAAIAEVAVPSSVSILAAIRLARRIAVAIATGAVEAKQVDDMTDAEVLNAFDKEMFDQLEAKQAEAEKIIVLAIPPGPPEEPSIAVDVDEIFQ